MYIPGASGYAIYYCDHRTNIHNFSDYIIKYGETEPQVILANQAVLACGFLSDVDCLGEFQIPEMLAIMIPLHYISSNKLFK